jgi:site-specific recombinase XerD
MPRRVEHGSRSLLEAMRGSLRKLFHYLCDLGVMSRPVVELPPTPYDAVATEYLSFLEHHRGFAEHTLELHRRSVEAFFGALAAGTPPVALAGLTSGDVEQFVDGTTAKLGKRSGMILRCAIEALVRYLVEWDHAPTTCAPFLPRQKTFALASLPSAPSREDLERMLSGIDRESALGRRDYAALLLLTTYGLRASEVVAIRLEDIDWRQRSFQVRQRKTRRSLTLPLTSEVMSALIKYLEHGRPSSHHRQLFLKYHAPIQPLTRATLYALTRKALKCAGIEAAHFGPHSLRHALATQLVRQGQSLKVVGDLLGHRVPEATLIYCKLAVEDLREVALPLPEVTS